MGLFPEKELERFIAMNPRVVECHEIINTQANVGIGRIDLLGVQYQPRKPEVFIVETKCGTIDCKAVGQLTRYMFALEEELEDCCYLQGCLVGRFVERDALHLINALNYRVFLAKFVSTVNFTVTETFASEVCEMTLEESRAIERTGERIRRYLEEFMQKFKG